MNKLSYIRKYYPASFFVFFSLGSILVGGLPALQMLVEKHLIDTAITGIIADSGTIFLNDLMR